MESINVRGFLFVNIMVQMDLMKIDKFVVSTHCNVDNLTKGIKPDVEIRLKGEIIKFKNSPQSGMWITKDIKTKI